MSTPWYAYPVTHGYYPSYDANVADTPHQAIDIGTPLDTPITAIKPGTVMQSDYAPWGGEVFIKPDDGSTEYYYYHFDQNDVTKGQHVNAGDLVGLSGGQNSGGSHPISTEWSTGPHTHVGYFTGYENTPIGTRPVGPDITETITYLKMGGNYGNGSTGPSPTASSGTNGSTPISSDIVTTSQHALTRIAVFFVALVIVIMGAYLLFHKQINTAFSKGGNVAMKAALL